MFNEMLITIYSILAIMTAKAYYMEDNNPIKSLLLIFIIGITSIFLSSIFVVIFVFNPNRWTDLLAEEKDINYEDKYPYEDISDKNEKICEKNYVFAKTPDDIVVMKYNEKDETFWYWADSNIEYKNLETVARKYIKTFNCKNIYIDRKTTLENDKKEREKQEEITKKKIEEWKTKQDEEEESVFAKLKTPQEKRSVRKESSAPSKANKYTRKGKLEEMSLFQPLLNRDKQKKKIKNDVSWGDWFKINKTKED
jgi:hypothetical protein